MRNKIDIVELLLNHHKTDVNIQSAYDGRTPLIEAARENNSDIVELLINEFDINVNLQDDYGRTALMWAILKDHAVVVDLLSQ